eukprot:Partr_v1_DN26386_c0_g1_i2_m43468 putative NAD-dependent lysine demalonylase and desuccinylase that specifically removes malonyl and succinyl groups on target proteins. Has weak NAD-dependent protein deacetylase activity
MLHGSLSHVICSLCKTRSPFSHEHSRHFSSGQAPSCADCLEKSDLRVLANKRRLPVGLLRPDVILYNEHHAAGDWIGEMAAKDMRKLPDMLIVMGTSLKVAGIKKLVKDISRAVHSSGKGKEIVSLLINKTDIATSEWKGVFDAAWLGDADDIVDFIDAGMLKRDAFKAAKIPKTPKTPKSAIKADSPCIDENQPPITDAFPAVVKKLEIQLVKDIKTPVKGSRPSGKAKKVAGNKSLASPVEQSVAKSPIT